MPYPIVLEEDEGAVLATSPDFPELTTFGDDWEAAATRAVQALEEAIAARIHDRKDIPPPSQGAACAILATLTAVKVILDSLVKSLCRSNQNKRTHTWVQYTVSVPYTTPTYGSAQMC